jgi:Ca-activated chloride channel family protein
MSFVNDFHFLRPLWLLALLPAAALVAALLRHKLSQGVWSAVCDEALLPYLLQQKAVKAGRGALAAGTAAAVLAIFAVAGPTWQRLPAPVFRNVAGLVIALDLSRSMDAQDIKPSRLIRARYKIADLLKQRKDGQTALLVYGGAAFTVTPLTDDTETINSQLSALTTDIMPSAGSNAAIVLAKAVDLFKQAGLQKGQIILVTDGVDNGQTLAAVQSLGDYQLSILGAGTEDGAPVPQAEGGFMKDAQGQIVIPKLNAGDLEKLAQAGHGIYQTMTADDSDIQTLLAALDKPVQQQGQKNANLSLALWADNGPWLALSVLPLAALLFRKGVLCLALLLLAPFPKNSYALAWQDLWRTKDQQAQQAYRHGDFTDAAQLFENPDWQAAAYYKSGQKDVAGLKEPKTATGFYNQGNVLAKAQHYEEAIKAYDQALAMNAKHAHPDAKLDDDAKFNKELVAKELEKQQQAQKNQQQQQDKDKPQDDQQKNGDKSERDQDKEKATQDQKQQDSQAGQGNKDHEQKPEQKPEKSAGEQTSDQQQQNQQPEPAKKPPQSAAEQAAQAERKKTTEPQSSEAQPAPATESAEQQQANEQWLKRIPDDPAGLLKRKFKYQYGQQGQPSKDANEW